MGNHNGAKAGIVSWDNVRAIDVLWSDTWSALDEDLLGSRAAIVRWDDGWSALKDDLWTGDWGLESNKLAVTTKDSSGWNGVEV